MNIKERPHTCPRMRIPRFRNDVAYNVGLGVIRVKPGISVNLHQRFSLQADALVSRRC